MENNCARSFEEEMRTTLELYDTDTVKLNPGTYITAFFVVADYAGLTLILSAMIGVAQNP